MGRMTKRTKKILISVFRSSVRSHATHAIGELENDDFKTRDFSPLIERVLAGVSIDFANCF